MGFILSILQVVMLNFVPSKELQFIANITTISACLVESGLLQYHILQNTFLVSGGCRVTACAGENI